MSRIHTDNWQLDTPRFMPEPTCHRAGLKADAFGVGRTLMKKFGQGSRMGLGIPFEETPTRLVDNSNRCLLLRDVQSDILFHDALR